MSIEVHILNEHRGAGARQARYRFDFALKNRFLVRRLETGGPLEVL